jgi:DIS3-like exonuclease 2
VCRITEHIGEAGNLSAESLRILKMHDIWSDEYEAEGQKLVSDKVHESLRVFTKNIDPVTGEWKIPEEEIKLRRDLRSKRIFTIDPLTAKDLDDALSIDKITDSIYEIGVHIADVSYFVQQGTELDKEAQLRCTSVYFVHKVYPMLPRLLCERLCSLNPQVDRLSYSIFFRININTGELDRSFTPQLCRTVMRSCAKWNYQLV